MFFRRMGRLALSLTLAATMGLGAVAGAETAAPAQNPAPAPQDFSGAQYLSIALGATNDEQGLRLIDGQPDGLTEAPQTGGRRSLLNAVGSDRYIYFDVHDTYIKGGFNQVIMTVTYEDVGLTPIELEYDGYDVVNPSNKADAWVKKRVSVAVRTNTGGVKTARLVLEDARFDNSQPGGADFRLVTADELTIRNISLMRSFGPNNLPVRVVVNGKEVLFDVPPFISPAGSTLVPMRKLFNALGVPDSDILWDNAARKVTAKKGETTIELAIDSDIAMVARPELRDGQTVVVSQQVKLSQPAIVKENRTLIPLRFVSENMGLTVLWNPDTHLISITAATP